MFSYKLLFHLLIKFSTNILFNHVEKNNNKLNSLCMIFSYLNKHLKKCIKKRNNNNNNNIKRKDEFMIKMFLVNKRHDKKCDEDEFKVERQVVERLMNFKDISEKKRDAYNNHGGRNETHKIFRIFNALAFINIIFHDFF